MTSDYFLNCIIDPQKGAIKVRGTIVISSIEKNMFFVLNRGLRWTKTIRKTASGAQVVKPHRSDLVEVPSFYNGDLWTFDAVDSLQNEFVVDIEYAGQIHPPSKDSHVPQMGYIKRDFVELACYCAWYPVPMNIETNMSFELNLEGPKDWTWIANATQQRVIEKSNTKEWKWKQKSYVNDIVMVGLPERNLHPVEGSHFWGSRDMVGSQKILDDDLSKMENLLEEWLGSRDSNSSIKFVVTPRTEGGAYARSGMIIVGGGYSTEVSLRRQVLQSMCHEICHEWFCKASVRSYDNWLDEALAEYCSIIVTEDYFDSGFLDWRIKTTKEKLEKQGHIPSIKSLLRDKEEAYAAYYFRGFLLLNELSNSVGRASFRKMVGEFAQICVRNKSVTSDSFLDFMEERLGEDTRKIADNWLEYDGVGIPSKE